MTVNSFTMNQYLKCEAFLVPVLHVKIDKKLVIIVSANGLAPVGARPLADTLLTTKVGMIFQSILSCCQFQECLHWPDDNIKKNNRSRQSWST